MSIEWHDHRNPEVTHCLNTNDAWEVLKKSGRGHACHVCMYVQLVRTTTNSERPDSSAREVPFSSFLSWSRSSDWCQLSRRKERWGSRREIHLYPLGTIPAPKNPKLSMAPKIRWGSLIGNTWKKHGMTSPNADTLCLYTSKATVAPKLKREWGIR